MVLTKHALILDIEQCLICDKYIWGEWVYFQNLQQKKWKKILDLFENFIQKI